MAKQRLDSTTVKSAIRGLTRLGILVEAVSKFLRELKRKYPERYAEVDGEIVRKYVERQGDGCFAGTRPSESKRRLPEAACERKHRRRYALMDPEYEQAVDCSEDPDDDEPSTKEENQELTDLKYIVERKLTGHQKVIIRAADVTWLKPKRSYRNSENRKMFQTLAVCGKNQRHTTMWRWTITLLWINALSRPLLLQDKAGLRSSSTSTRFSYRCYSCVAFRQF